MFIHGRKHYIRTQKNRERNTSIERQNGVIYTCLWLSKVDKAARKADIQKKFSICCENQKKDSVYSVVLAQFPDAEKEKIRIENKLFFYEDDLERDVQHLQNFQ